MLEVRDVTDIRDMTQEETTDKKLKSKLKRKSKDENKTSEPVNSSNWLTQISREVCLNPKP